MAIQAAARLLVQTILASAEDERIRNILLSLIGAVFVPLILAIMVILSIGAGGAAHNKAAVNLAFHGGSTGSSMPAEYREYILQMQDSFAELDKAIDTIEEPEGEIDDSLIKAVYYALFFGTRLQAKEDTYYKEFTDCFVKYEDRVRVIVDEKGNEQEESYTAAVPLKDLVAIFRKLGETLGRAVSYEEQANAVEVYHQALYGSGAPLEGDGFEEWGTWVPQGAEEVYQLPAGEEGSMVVTLARSRLNDPYSQSLRGKGRYTDCSYLALWCYRQVGISLPGTAAEQARYCVENSLTVSRENLQPGDLVFWSHKPNGRYRNITHVGVYAGGGKVVDASSSKGKVVYRDIFDADKLVLFGRPYAGKK